MIRATASAALDRVCVQYQQRRFGGILQTQTTRHIDVLAQYEAVFSHLEALPSLDERWSPSVHRQMVNHVLAIWEHPRRLPPDFRKELFRIAAQPITQALPEPRLRYSGNRRQAIKQSLLLQGRRRTLTILQRVARTVRAVRGRGSSIRRRWANTTRALQQLGLRIYYRWRLEARSIRTSLSTLRTGTLATSAVPGNLRESSRNSSLALEVSG